MREASQIFTVRTTAVAVLALGILFAPEGVRGAESEADAEASAEYEQLLDEGRSAYNDKQWEKAASHYEDAAQLAPRKPLIYRNLARSYFQNGDYARATTFYDYYLNLAGDSAKTDRIRRERKLAAHRAGDKVWTVPDSQKRVLDALRTELTEGRAYTEGGGGAWALYKTLLRTGYVHPDLGHLQTRLRKALLDEFEGLLVPETGSPMPTLSLDEWQRQQRRLEAIRSVSAESGALEVVERRMTIVDAAIAMLNGRYERAAELAQSAIESNPDMPFLRWYEITSLVRSEQYERANERIERAEAAFRNGESKTQRQYLQIMRAMIAQREEDAETAAELYLELLE